jgi:hypothetical protein
VNIREITPGTSTTSWTNSKRWNFVASMTFLPSFYSIPDDYEHFQIAIETQEKLPQLEGLKIKLLEEYEGRKRNSKENVPDAMFINKNPGRSNQPKKSKNSKTEITKLILKC